MAAIRAAVEEIVSLVRPTPESRFLRHAAASVFDSVAPAMDEEPVSAAPRLLLSRDNCAVG